jgi:hemolysin III
MGVEDRMISRVHPPPSSRTNRPEGLLSAGGVMLFFDLREPINAWSHGAGMLLALPVTWLLLKRCARPIDSLGPEPLSASRRYQSVKALCLLVFGLTLIACYGISALFHAAKVSGEPLLRLQRLDHVGIYLLIAGTYTPVAWGLMRGSWWWGTLTTVWTVALACAARVWCGGMLPIWVSTLTYLVMGWGALFCYFELARIFSHRTLLPLPLGGVFYSVGAILNLTKWPALYPGVFAAHEIFHLLVIAGSACHIFFMLQVVIPSPEPASLPRRAQSRQPLLARAHPPATTRAVFRRPHFLSPSWVNHLLHSRAVIRPASASDILPHDNNVEPA